MKLTQIDTKLTSVLCIFFALFLGCEEPSYGPEQTEGQEVHTMEDGIETRDDLFTNQEFTGEEEPNRLLGWIIDAITTIFAPPPSPPPVQYTVAGRKKAGQLH